MAITARRILRWRGADAWGWGRVECPIGFTEQHEGAQERLDSKKPSILLSCGMLAALFCGMLAAKRRTGLIL
jgi:hypothetical protein